MNLALFIRKNPSPQTLLARSYAATCPESYEPATEAEAAAWESAQLAAGWTPAPLPEPEPAVAPIRFDNWLDFVRHVQAKAPGVYERVVGAALQSPPLFIWLSKAMGQGEMFLDHPETIAGFAALVSGGVITQAERDAIFTR
jgi:hypothetical protein